MAGKETVANYEPFIFVGLEGVRYCLLFEGHSLGPIIHLPKETNCLFWETNLLGEKNQYEIPPADLIALTVTGSLGREEVFKMAYNAGLIFAFGDVATEEMMEEIDSAYVADLKDRIKIAFGVGLVGEAAVLRRLCDLNKSGDRKIVCGLSRKRFFTLMAVSGITCTADGILGRIRPEISAAYADSFDARRLSSRLSALRGHLHFGNQIVFNRDIIMALKMKMIGGFLKESGGRDPLVGCVVGSGHAGIEDFLYLPDDLLREMLININPSFVKRSVAQYGEENVASVRLIAQKGGLDFYDLPRLTDNKLLRELLKVK